MRLLRLFMDEYNHSSFFSRSLLGTKLIVTGFLNCIFHISRMASPYLLLFIEHPIFLVIYRYQNISFVLSKRVSLLLAVFGGCS